MTFRSLRHVLSAMAPVLVAPAAMATTSETGGSGLVRVDHAWSMPLSGFVVTTYGTYYSNDFTPGTDRLFRLVPNLTKGLGGGFEASAALPFEGLSQNLDGAEFDRRFDLRRRDLQMKARWTGPIAGPRARVGVQGSFGLPLARLQDRRAGGDRDPESAFDPGVSGLASFNVGAFDFPVRVHANLGYWWSRDDGSTYYRDHSFALPLDFDAIAHNDVLTAGIAVEAGFRRFVGFTEITTEQLVGARAQVAGRENLWRVTPGIRTEVGSNVGMTIALSFDASQDDPTTDFDPREVFPDLEMRIGLTLGQVLARVRHEDADRQRRTAQDLAWALVEEPTEPDPAGAQVAPMRDAAAVTPTSVAPGSATPASTTSTSVAPVSTTSTSGAGAPAHALPEAPGWGTPAGSPPPDVRTPSSLDRLEARLDRIETSLRIQALEARLAAIEGPASTRATPPASTTAPDSPVSATLDPPSPMTPAPVASESATGTPGRGTPAPTATDPELRATVQRLEAEVRALRADRPEAPPPSGTTVTPPAPGPSVTLALPGATSSPVDPAPAATRPDRTTPPSRPEPVRDGDTVRALLDELEALTRPDPEHGTSVPATTAPIAPVADPSPAPPADSTGASVSSAPVVPESLPLAIGERLTFGSLPDPMQDDGLLATLESLGPRLGSTPDARLLVIVEGGPDDRALALAESQQVAEALRRRLVAGGASADQVTALGLGRPGVDVRGWQVALERTP